MQSQFKLYKIDKAALNDTLKQLIIDNKYKFIAVTENVIALEYEYSSRSYGCLLEYMSYFQASQYIVTTSVYYRLLSAAADNGIKIAEINLAKSLEIENERISGLIRSVNWETEKAKSLEELLDELKWYNYDEGIDIYYMSFLAKALDNNRQFKFAIFNNGVITTDSNQIWETVVDLLGRILT